MLYAKLSNRMKKVITLCMAAMFLVATAMSAQTAATPAKKDVKKEAKKADAKVTTTKKDVTKEVKKTDVKATKATTTTAASAQHLKKDGTPDKRYKENKAAATTTKHLKKDGTPDMRYKENKTTQK